MALDKELVATVVDGPRRDQAQADAHVDPTTLPRGTTIGRYVLIDKIGQGGMGVVYSAYDQMLHRRVAVKLVTLRGDPEGQRRLLAEARAMAQLSHAAIVAIHDVGERDGQLFLAMAFIDGTTLRRWQTRDGCTWRAIVAMYRQIGEGLAFAHDERIVHRDFKPDNVLVDDDGRPYIADFGLAKIARATAPPSDGSSSTVTIAAGTPGYGSPQQMRGEPTDARTDQYAFCVSLFEALHRAMPSAHPPPPEEVPRRILAAVERGLADDPAERWPSMRELLAELAPPAPPPRRRVLTVAAAVALPAAVASWLALRGAPAVHSCEVPAAREWWTPARATLAAAFAREGMQADDLVAALDDWSLRWTHMAEGSCHATSIGAQTPQLLDLRARCLDHALDVTTSLVDLVSHGDRHVLARAGTLADQLPPLAPCQDAAGLLGAVPLPADPVRRGAIAELRKQLATAQAEVKLESFREAADQLDAIASAVHAASYPPLTFELHATRTRVEVNRDADPAAAADAAWSAIAADPTRRDYAMALVWIDLVWIVSQMQHAPAQAIELGRVAEELVDHVDDHELHAILDHNLGSALLAAGRLDEAIARFERSRAGYVELHEDRQAIAAIQGEALAFGSRGDKAKQLALFEQCVALAERVPHAHVLHANVLSALGILYLDARRYDDAHEVLRRALDAIGDGRDDPALLAAIHANVGTLLAREGKLAEAEVEYRAQLDIARAQLGSDTSDVELAWFNLGAIQGDRHHYSDALVSLRTALELLERVPRAAISTGGFAGPGVIAQRVVTAELALGHAAAALASADAILALAQQANVGPEVAADVHFALAMAAWATGDRARARSTMQLANAEYRQAGAASDEADAWLAAH